MNAGSSQIVSPTNDSLPPLITGDNVAVIPAILFLAGLSWFVGTVLSGYLRRWLVSSGDRSQESVFLARDAGKAARAGLLALNCALILWWIGLRRGPFSYFTTATFILAFACLSYAAWMVYLHRAKHRQR